MVSAPSPLEWSLIALAALLGLACIGVLAWQMRPSGPPVSSRDRLSRSVLSGFLFTGSVVALFIIVGITDKSYRWTAGSVGAIICCVAPFQILVTIGTYYQFGIAARLRQYHDKLIGKQ